MAVGTGLGGALPLLRLCLRRPRARPSRHPFGLQGTTALVVASVLVGIALLVTSPTVGLLSGGPPLKRTSVLPRSEP